MEFQRPIHSTEHAPFQDFFSGLVHEYVEAEREWEDDRNGNRGLASPEVARKKSLCLERASSVFFNALRHHEAPENLFLGLDQACSPSHPYGPLQRVKHILLAHCFRKALGLPTIFSEPDQLRGVFSGTVRNAIH